MMSLLMAGHETSGIASTWGWYWLSQTPAAESAPARGTGRRARAAARPTPEDLPRLEYVRRTFDEVLRLSPPIYAVDRQVIEDDVVCGYRIPKGLAVLVSQYVTHRHPSVLDRSAGVRARSVPRSASAGRPRSHTCRSVAVRDAAWACGSPSCPIPLLMATLARRYRLRLKPGHPVEELARVNLAPRYGMQMLIEERR